MKIAVLMSTYNGEKFIKEQIDSILSQSIGSELELWVRDDGSSDSTQSILTEYEKAGKLKWYTGKNLGPAHSFLDLIYHCPEYDYYAFADQDDYWMPDKIINGINKLAGLSCPALYFSNAELVGEDLSSLGRNVYQSEPKSDLNTLCCAGGLLGCTMIFNRKLAQCVQNKKIPEEIVMHDFYIAELCSAIDGKIIYDDKAYMKYRQHGNNVIGVSRGFVQTIRNRFKDILSKSKISIAQQANEILTIYENELSETNKEWLNLIAEYPSDFGKKIRLAFSNKTKYINKNMGFKIRASIFLGNR